MTIDLDALEKLADEAPGKKWALEAGFLEIDGMSPLFQLFGSPCDCGEGENPICGSDGEAEAAAAFMIAAQPATIKALIAELREARGLLQGFIDDEADAVTNPLGGLSLGGLMDARDNSGCVYQSAALADRIAQTRAFLARNGKGEG